MQKDLSKICLFNISAQAIPDTKLTIKKYADVKFEYLSYCLKVFFIIITIYIVHICQSRLIAILDIITTAGTFKQVKELDDEDYSYQAMQEPLYRVETGNYEYR